MSDKVDKYADEEESLTQVRRIIKQLNEDKPSRERNREVVVRADGTKVVRVTKKRKVMVSAREKNRASRKRFVYALAGAFVFLFLMVAFLFVRMAAMSSSSYLQECQSQLQQSWGADSVQIEGAGVDGTSFHLSSVVAEFPETCMLKRVEMRGIEATLDWLSFFRSKIQGEDLKMDSAIIVLRSGARMNMPLYQGDALWKFQRMDCKNLTVLFENEETAPLALKDAAAYMYYPHVSSASSVVILSSGALHIKGWKTVNITESKAHISSNGIDDFSLRGTTDNVSDIAEHRRTSIAFAGRIVQEADFCGPYAVESDNMSFADFTRGRFEEFFSARTKAVSQGRIRELATMTLSPDTDEPVFNGEFHLRNISLSSFPALMSITEHIEPAKRRFYNPLSLHRGHVVIDYHEGNISVEIPEGALQERDLVSLRGKMILNAANELSGEMSYGIPMLLARVEYPDGRPDPIFHQSGDWAVLRTGLRGKGNMPDDDMSEVEARAVIARKERPARIPFTEFDIDRMAEKMTAPKKEEGLFSSSAAEDASQNPLQQNDSLRNPFESADDPFAPASPF